MMGKVISLQAKQVLRAVEAVHTTLDEHPDEIRHLLWSPEGRELWERCQAALADYLTHDPHGGSTAAGGERRDEWEHTQTDTRALVNSTQGGTPASVANRGPHGPPAG